MKFIKKIKEGKSYYNALIGWKFWWRKKDKFFTVSLRVGKRMIKFIFDNWSISFLIFTNKPNCDEFIPKFSNKIITIW